MTSNTQKSQTITIKPPNMHTLELTIIGTAPYVQHKFGKKAREKMIATHKAGSQARSKRTREPRDFDEDYREAMYLTDAGKNGMPASAFRNGMISACRTVGYKMTHAKLAVFVEADGYDADDATPLVHIEGKPEQHITQARNDNGSCDLRVRPMWKTWRAKIRIRFDADMFSGEDVTNLLARVGMQGGIGEGRPDSKKSAGLGWGLFRIATEAELRSVA